MTLFNGMVESWNGMAERRNCGIHGKFYNTEYMKYIEYLETRSIRIILKRGKKGNFFKKGYK